MCFPSCSTFDRFYHESWFVGFFSIIRVLSEARAISISLALFEMKLLCPIPFSSYPLSKPFGCYFFPANKTSFFNAECIWSEWIERKMKFNKVKLCQRQLSQFFVDLVDCWQCLVAMCQYKRLHDISSTLDYIWFPDDCFSTFCTHHRQWKPIQFATNIQMK